MLRVFTNKDNLRVFNPNVTLLQQHFKDQGYWSVGIGKVQLIYLIFQYEKTTSLSPQLHHLSVDEESFNKSYYGEMKLFFPSFSC